MRPLDENPARALLSSLLRRAERASGERRVSERVDYERIPRSTQARDAFVRSLELLERANVVSLERRRAACHLIDRVVLRDPDALAEHLGVERFSTRARALEAAVRRSVTLDARLETLLEECVGRWARGEAAFGLKPEIEACDRVVERFVLLAGLLSGVAAGLDRRTFSVRFAGRSKALESHQAMLCQMLRRVTGSSESDDALLSRMGLERFPAQILASGGFDVAFPEPDADARLPGTAYPHVSVDADWLAGLRWRGDGRRAVLTIENLTTFHRYVRAYREPRHVVVYSGGFPSEAVVAFLRRLRETNRQATFFHWSDIDASGFEILAHLSRALETEVVPFLMCPVLRETRGVPSPSEDGALWLEQEMLELEPLIW